MNDIDQQRELKNFIRKTSFLVVVIFMCFFVAVPLSDYLPSNLKLVVLSVFLLLVLIVLIKTYKLNNMVLRQSISSKITLVSEDLGKELASMPADSIAYTHFPTKYGDALYLIAIPGRGVFIVEVCHTPGEMQVRGEDILINNTKPERDFVLKLLKNKVWIEECMRHKFKGEVYVCPVLVFTRANFNGILNLNGVYLLKRQDLIQFMLTEKLPSFNFDRHEMAKFLLNLKEKSCL